MRGDRFYQMMARRNAYRKRMESGPDSTEVRLTLLARVEEGEITLEEAQQEIRRLRRLPLGKGEATS